MKGPHIVIRTPLEPISFDLRDRFTCTHLALAPRVESQIWKAWWSWIGIYIPDRAQGQAAAHARSCEAVRGRRRRCATGVVAGRVVAALCVRTDINTTANTRTCIRFVGGIFSRDPQLFQLYNRG